MKDNEIIKALGKTKFGGHSCLECKHRKVKGDNRCGIKGCRIAQDALDLINRQKAEIERLTEENKKQKIILDGIEDAVHPLPFETDYDKAIKQAKSKAIREFAERLIDITVGNWEYRVDIATIDNLVKEMVGDSNA